MPCLNTIDRGWAAIPAWRTYVNGLLFAASVVLGFLALDQLARQQLNRHLDSTAGAILGALVHAHAPHQWSGRDHADIVAGQAFGTTDYAFVADGFLLRSQGNAIEVGLVLAGAIDLGRYSVLEIDLASGQAGTLAVVVRSSLESDACTSEPVGLPANDTLVVADLRKLRWTCAGKHAPAPLRAEMLRLRIQLDNGSSLSLVDVRARSRLELSPESLDQLQLPLLPSLQDSHAFDRALDRASADNDSRILPIFQLSTNARVEQVLVARDRIEQRIADAILVPEGKFAEVAQHARDWRPAAATSGSDTRAYWLLGLYALALAWIRLRPPARPRWRALLELLGVTAVPVALVAGGGIGDDINRPVLVAGAMTLVFALSLLAGSAPAQPGKRTLKRGWWVALISLGLAFGVVLATGGRLPSGLPGLAQVLHYLVWAGVLQFVICVIVAERIERVIGSALWATFGAALVFALLTTPNGMLMQLSFAGGLIWVWNWQRHRALLANILAQAACTLLLVTALPAVWLHSGEVSARFFLN